MAASSLHHKRMPRVRRFLFARKVVAATVKPAAMTVAPAALPTALETVLLPSHIKSGTAIHARPAPIHAKPAQA
jgi:hypothetical protein